MHSTGAAGGNSRLCVNFQAEFDQQTMQVEPATNPSHKCLLELQQTTTTRTFAAARTIILTANSWPQKNRLYQPHIAS